MGTPFLLCFEIKYNISERCSSLKGLHMMGGSDYFPECADEIIDCKDITELLFSDIYINLDNEVAFLQNLKIPTKEAGGKLHYFKPPIISGFPESLRETLSELINKAVASKEEQQENWFPLTFKGECKTASFRGQYFEYSSGKWLCLRRMDVPPQWDQLGISNNISDVLFHMLDPSFGKEKHGHSVGGSGLFLITGPMGEGKTTTFHSLCQEATSRFGGVTVEMGNPIEFASEGFYGRDSFGRIFQKNTDDSNFGKVFYENLRMAPKRICIEEIRTPVAANAALEASRSGIAVMATFHGTGVMEALTRFAALAAAHPDTDRDLVMKDLSLSLKAVLNQRLSFDPEKGVQVAMNGLFVDPFDNALKTAIQNNNLASISSRFEDQQARIRSGKNPVDFMTSREKEATDHINLSEHKEHSETHVPLKPHKVT